jgi:hypothetical protein
MRTKIWRRASNPVLAASIAVAVLAAPVSASAAITGAVFVTYSGEVRPATGAPVGGFYSVDFMGSPSVSGAVERGGVVIAATPQPSPVSGQAVLETTLQPGDVIHLHDPTLPAGSQDMTTTFTGYPTINPVQCGQTVVTGATAPGQPVDFVGDGYSMGGADGAEWFENIGSGYTATFRSKPIPPGALVVVNSSYVQATLEVKTEFVVKAQGSCPPPVVTKSAKHKPVKHKAKRHKRKHRRNGRR